MNWKGKTLRRPHRRDRSRRTPQAPVLASCSSVVGHRVGASYNLTVCDSYPSENYADVYALMVNVMSE